MAIPSTIAVLKHFGNAAEDTRFLAQNTEMFSAPSQFV